MPRKPLSYYVDPTTGVLTGGVESITPAILQDIVTELYKSLDSDGSGQMPASYAAGTRTPDSLAVLSDITSAVPTFDPTQYLKTDGTSVMPAGYAPTQGGHVATKGYVDGQVPATLDALGDVSGTAPTADEALAWSGTEWAPTPVLQKPAVDNLIAAGSKFQGIVQSSPKAGELDWTAVATPYASARAWVCGKAETVPATVPDIGGSSVSAGEWIYDTGSAFLLIPSSSLSKADADARYLIKAHDPASTYKKGDVVSAQNSIYSAKAAVAAKAFDPTDWDVLVHGVSGLLDHPDVKGPASGTLLNGDTLAWDGSQWQVSSSPAVIHWLPRGQVAWTSTRIRANVKAGDLIVDNRRIYRVDKDMTNVSPGTMRSTGYANLTACTPIVEVYDALETYYPNDVVYEAGGVYRCVTAVTKAEPFDRSKWFSALDASRVRVRSSPPSTSGTVTGDMCVVGDTLYIKGGSRSFLTYKMTPVP